MFDAQHTDATARTMRVSPMSCLVRDASLGAERSYMAPILFWIAHGQGRYSVNGELHGYTANNAIFLPANTSHSIELTSRCQGTAVFFADQSRLNFPDQVVHLRLQGVQAQAEIGALIEDLRVEAQGTAEDRDEVLYHRAALTMLWLNRQGGKKHVPQPRVSDMLRAIAQPKR